MSGVFIIIPARNEEHSIKKVLQSIKKCVPRATIVVINDASSDATARVAKNEGVRVIHNRINIGTGRSIQRGLLYALKSKANRFVLLDADGQHDPDHIPHLLNALREKVDIVIASRYISLTKNCTSLFRCIGTKIISYLIYKKHKIRIYDSTSGYRVLNRKTSLFLSTRYATVFPEPETIISLGINKFIIKEISVEMKPRIYGTSFISPTKALYLMLYIITKIFR